MSENLIVGAWKLISYEVHTDDEIFYPLGKDAFGYIMYTQDGYMSVTMCSLNRDSFSSEALTGGTSAEKLQAASTYISYCGRYQLLGDRVIQKEKWAKDMRLVLSPEWRIDKTENVKVVKMRVVIYIFTYFNKRHTHSQSYKNNIICANI